MLLLYNAKRSHLPNQTPGGSDTHVRFSPSQPDHDFPGDPSKGTPQEYNLRVGHAIETLRDELPRIFKNGLCDTSIYSPSIRLTESTHTNASLQSKPLYLTLAGAVRWSFKAWFKNLELEIQSIRVNDRGGRGLSGFDYNGGGNGDSGFDGRSDGPSRVHMSASTPGTVVSPSMTRQTSMTFASVEQPVSAEASQIIKSKGVGRGTDGAEEIMSPVPSTSVTVRWKLTGTVRSSIVLTARGPTSPPPTSYSGIFVYEFDDMGLIDEHRIENIMPTPSPEAIQRAMAWWGWLLHRTHPATAAAVGVEQGGRSNR
ncbi:hypothetical protein DFQ27_001325 [Actinomortierella ambigua]|uniref:Uncharacterized protein n=1 Tax=Actinomortierella ambigua TaxID=1343610 RepID=A0A9P6U8K7_9FUNG|nr:hypothetical protein DFQ27_001325 [Actinomortierella ambigua]